MKKYICDLLSNPSFMGALLGALITGGIALFIYRMQSVNAKQTERQSQAVKISAWIGPVINVGKDIEHPVLNSSNAPVYQVIVSVVGLQGAFPYDGREVPDPIRNRACLSVLPPGKFIAKTEFMSPGMNVKYGIEIAFTDASGVHWIREGNGRLREIYESPIKYYGIGLPIDWQ